MARLPFAAALLFAASLMAASSKPPDPHFLVESTHALVGKSVFVHGYLHGYEEGFHLGDLDLQMGRSAREIGRCKQGREPADYRREFGDRELFKSGYRAGARAGYADAFAGRVFRALDELRSIGVLAAQPAHAAPNPAFDHGFSLGYSSGQHRGLEDARRGARSIPPAVECPAASAKTPDPPVFCSAYAGGFQAGYSDGLIAVGQPALEQAAVRDVGH